MKNFICMLLMMIPGYILAQSYQGYRLQHDKLIIRLSDGTINIIPLSNEAVRLQFQKNGISETREIIFKDTPSTPQFKFSETPTKLILSLKTFNVLFDKQKNSLQYLDKTGHIFLAEKAGSRKLLRDSVAGQACFSAEQTFDSPADEHLFGLGQFQDGYYDLRNASRKLIQVNTQISIPFIYSSRGFGLLWHQYGLTYFNPADNEVALAKKVDNTSSAYQSEVTTTSGTQKISQQQSLYEGRFVLPQNGKYTIMLDLGNMDNRHLVKIDGHAYIDQSNLWLPPAVSKIIKLNAGEHLVQVICKSTNKPKLTWRKCGDETTFRSPDAKSLDYVVFYGKNADNVIASYRNLSGNVPLLPLWAYGFWQCRERYQSGQHLVQTIEKFRKEQIPVDVIVQDWQYWGKYGWGVPKFDETNYADPEKFIKQLHDLNAHLTISVWENLAKESGVAKTYGYDSLYIPKSPWIDIFNPNTQATHWRAINDNLFSKGVDSWWMDATEPENDALAGKQTYFGPGDFYRLTYPFFVSKAVYEGQRKTTEQKRVVILTRSAFPGQQRFGIINWSGDIGSDWDTYKRQMVAGLNYSMTGMPYWTTDIGGFFRPGKSQYADPKYQELLTRWFQWGTFNPIFRIHGYQSETEPWMYGPSVEANMRLMLNLRYRLIPYIYSEAWQVTKAGSTIMRPLIMDFRTDTAAVERSDEFMFGKNILVAPVTEPGIDSRPVYLPKSVSWYDFWTGKRYTGGKTIDAATPKDKLPLFVKAGTILPLGPFTQYTSIQSQQTLELRIYTGADGQTTLYNDEGDNYNYENGNNQKVSFTWNDKTQTLTIGSANGSYKGALKNRIINIVWVNNTKGIGVENAVPQKKIYYIGKQVNVKMPAL